MRRFVAVLGVWVLGLAWVLGGLAPVSASAQVPAAVSAVSAVSTPGGFTSLAPTRLLDTRDGTGVPFKAAVPAGGTVHLQVAGRGGVPASGVSAVVLNVTVASPSTGGFVTVFGDGTTPRPTASNLNFVKAQIVPNLVIAPVGANGKVALYNGSAGAIQLIADVSGYYLAGAPVVAGAFGSLAPSRLLDTRDGTGVPAKAAVPAGGTVHLQVAGRGGVPASGVSAVVLNVTVASPSTGGFVTVFGDGTTPRPTASNLNFVKAQIVPNLVIAPVGANGKVALYNGSGGAIQLIADVSGYYLAGAPVVAGAFGSLAPSRLLDTRDGTGVPAKAAVPAGGTVHLQVAGRGGVPASGVSAVVLNVTVASPSTGGFVTVFGDGTTPRPTASNLNFVKAQIVPNLVIAPVGAGGKVALYNGSGGTIQVIADVAGWFSDTTAAPTAPGPVTNASGAPTGTTVALSWTNPTSASLTGVMIRRATGGTAPASATTGTLVKDVATPATSVTDSALTPGTTYSYALFAHDGTPLYATAATVTTTTTTGPGGISGFVTDAGGTHHGLAGVVVNVTAYSLADLVTATTSADGSYTVSGLAAGNHYTVCFTTSGATGGSSDATGYINQCYDNQPTSQTRTPVTVTTGVTTSGINAALAVAGAISGTVTDAAGAHHGLANVMVNAFSSTTRASQQVTTGADGSYVLTGFPAGSDYEVYFNDFGATGGSSDALGYFDQIWQNQPASGTPTPVTVTNGTTTPGINAALVGAAAMSGSVTDAAGTHHGLANVSVDVSSLSAGRSWTATTAADGSYAVKGLAAGTDYEVCFSTGSSGATGGSSDALGYLDQCYNNQPASGTPTAVTVTAGATRTGVNAALAAAGAVSGTVTDAGGTLHGLANVQVYVNSPSTSEFGFATTASNGSYTVTGLPAGTDYEVCFSTGSSATTGGSSDALGYLNQCYNNKPTSGTPNPVTVTPGANRTGVSAALAAAGAVSGTVTDAAGAHHGLENVQVSVLSLATGDGGYGQTAADGSYTVTGLPAHTDYQVCFEASSATGGSSDALGYANQCYNNQPASGTPTPVSVTTGVNKTGIKAALAAAGAISGTVTDAGGTHHGLKGAWVTVSSQVTGDGGYVVTAADGSYSVTGLAPGTDYQVCFEGAPGETPAGATGGSSDAFAYVHECYNNQPLTGTPTSVTVTAGANTAGIDAALIGGGAISGTVTDAGGGHNGWSWQVSVYSASTAGYGFATSQTDPGNYTVIGLPAATDYEVCFSATGGYPVEYVDQCYNNQSVSGTPTPVTVTLGATTTGINAAIARAAGALPGTPGSLSLTSVLPSSGLTR